MIVSHFVGGRDSACAMWFMDEVVKRVQMTRDGHKAFLEVVDGAFGCDVDQAMLVKI